MRDYVARYWPPTKTRGLSIYWSVILGFVFQLVSPAFLAAVGAQRAALFAMLPGLWPILWATGGWFSSIAPMGYIVMYSVNTVFFGMVFLAAFRTCVCLRRHA